MPHWLVIDLEATTEEGGWPLKDMEIIEIGACIVSLSGQEVAHFQRFVRPARRPQLTRFCRELTHIQQTDIDAAASFSSVWTEFEQWLQQCPEPLRGWASWGEYDRQQLELSWQLSNVTSHLQQLPHHNLKHGFAHNRQLKRSVGLRMALQLAGMNFQGNQHRALEDARNTARLLTLALPASELCSR